MRFISTLLVVIFSCMLFNADAQDRKSMTERIRSMDKEANPEKNLASMFEIIGDFKLDTIRDMEDIDVLKGLVALSFLKAWAYPKFEVYISLIKNKFNQTSYLNMAADWLISTKKDPDYALLIAQKTVVLYDSYKNDSSARPSGFPQDDWNRFMKMAAYPYYEIYAAALHAKDSNKTALFYEEKALKGVDSNVMLSSLALYAALLEANGQKEKAYGLLLKTVSLGKSDLNMDAQLKRLCIEKMGEDSATVFLDAIRSNIVAAYQQELTKRIIEGKDAPDFSLYDLNGHCITLSDLKGRVVVLDFWATWCAPCIASLPAMEKLSKKHPEVVFLFIDSGEKETDVRSWINKQKLSIQVLMDTAAAKVSDAYAITGIPTKIVIDMQGRERFISSGYSSDAALMNEMEAMITIAQAQ